MNRIRRDVYVSRRVLHKIGALIAAGCLLAAGGFAAAACSGGSEGEEAEEDAGGNGGNGGNGGSGGSSTGSSDPSWQVETIEGGGWGLFPDLVTTGDGRIGVAYYRSNAVEDGPCEEIGDSPPTRLRWPIHVAMREGSDWAIETVAEPLFVGQPPGLDLEVSAEGSLTLASLAGEPLEDFGYCGANDAALYSRKGAGDWAVETVAASSSDVVGTDEAGADFGEVVGYWPALGYDDSGRAAFVFKDVHAGGRQGDDFKIASLEMARGGADSWELQSVDWYRGAGDRPEIAFDDEDRPVVAYNLPFDEEGIWVTRVGSDGEGVERARLHADSGSEKASLAVDPESGTLHVIYYNAERGFPELATLERSDKFESLDEGWSFREEGIGNSRFDEGYEPSMAFGPNGLLHILYYRCTVASGGLGDCNSSDDALVHAWRDGGIWEEEVVDEGGDGVCGESPSLGFDAEGRPVAAYRCERLVDGALETTVKFAVKK